MQNTVILKLSDNNFDKKNFVKVVDDKKYLYKKPMLLINLESKLIKFQTIPFFIVLTCFKNLLFTFLLVLEAFDQYLINAAFFCFNLFGKILS